MAPAEVELEPAGYGVLSFSHSGARLNAVARVIRLAGSKVRCEIGLEFVYPTAATKDVIRRLTRPESGA